MLKGFIDYKNGKIPFVVEGYIMELFSEDYLLNDFISEKNFKTNFVIQGYCDSNGISCKKGTFLVEKSIGNTCYLSCYIINMPTKGDYDTIGIQSSFLDDIFKYSYNFIDMARKGINLSYKSSEVYNIDFSMDEEKYNLIFRIGYDSKFGLLEDWNRKGELLIKTKTCEIQECYNIIKVFYRLCMFMQSQSDVSFKEILLYKDGIKSGFLYCPMIMEDITSMSDMLFENFDVMKYIPKMLNSIALDSGNKIKDSIPLGHLGTTDSKFLPHRFLEQVISFEYLLEKLNPKLAKSKNTLKTKLKRMFKEFSEHFKDNLLFDDISCNIVNLRNDITHGHFYYYDFKDCDEIKRLMILMDKLIKIMSLRTMGFTDDEIKNFPTLFQDLEYKNYN